MPLPDTTQVCDEERGVLSMGMFISVKVDQSLLDCSEYELASRWVHVAHFFFKTKCCPTSLAGTTRLKYEKDMSLGPRTDCL